MEQEKSYQEIRKELIEKYQKDVVPKLSRYEKERQKYFKQFKILNIVTLTSYSIVLIVLLYQSIKISNILLMLEALPLSIPFVIIWAVICRNIGKGFITKLKKIAMPYICSCFPNLRWVPERDHSTVEYQKSKVLIDFDYIRYDDCFEGKYKNVDFVIEEVCTERQGQKIGQKFPVFNGVVIQFKIHKKFNNSHTLIYPTYDVIFHKSPLNHLHYTELEDVRFQKKYNVFTNDDVAARYLITPTLMEKINNIKSRFNAEQIYMAFYNEKLFLSLCTYENLFEFKDLRKSICDYGQLLKMGEEIISILKLIDYFKLDQNIGM